MLKDLHRLALLLHTLEVVELISEVRTLVKGFSQLEQFLQQLETTTRSTDSLFLELHSTSSTDLKKNQISHSMIRAMGFVKEKLGWFKRTVKDNPNLLGKYEAFLRIWMRVFTEIIYSENFLDSLGSTHREIFRLIFKDE